MLRHTGEGKMIKGLILSLQFLTRIPISINIDFNEETIGKSTFFYPLVGAFVGGIAALIHWAFQPLGKEFSAFSALFVMIILTGGLHLDGLADTFDGFLSNKDRDRTIEIMKDSRIGAFGVIGLILTILLQYILLTSFSDITLPLIFSLANSRLIVVIIMTNKKVAKPGGLGELFHRSCSKKYIIGSSILYIAILILVDVKYLIPFLTSYLVAEIISSIAYKKIDGLTGDVYGAIIEISQSVSLIAFLGMSLWI